MIGASVLGQTVTRDEIEAHRRMRDEGYIQRVGKEYLNVPNGADRLRSFRDGLPRGSWDIGVSHSAGSMDVHGSVWVELKIEIGGVSMHARQHYTTTEFIYRVWENPRRESDFLHRRAMDGYLDEVSVKQEQ